MLEWNPPGQPLSFGGESKTYDVEVIVDQYKWWLYVHPPESWMPEQVFRWSVARFHTTGERTNFHAGGAWEQHPCDGKAESLLAAQKAAETAFKFLSQIA